MSLRARDPWLLGALGATAVALLAAGLAAASNGMVLAFADAASHVATARRVFDNGEPSLAQLGTHWLPLLHVLELPLVPFDVLYTSGAAGAIVSALASLATTWFVYRLALELGAPRSSAFLAALLLAASPSFAYSGVVPMLPALVMAAASANVLHLVRWVQTGTGLSLALAGIWLTIATVVHFDTWVLGPLELVIVAVVAQRRWRSRVRTEATVIVWAVAASFGVAIFALMNLAIYGDVLAFLDPVAGTGGDAFATDRHSLAALLDYPHAAWLMAGPGLAVAGVAGTAAFVWHNRRNAARLTALLLFYPLAWYTLQAAASGSLIKPDETLSEWVNLRYATTILPPLALFAIVGFRRRATIATATVAVLASSAFMLADGRVAAWEDARGDVPAQQQLRAAANWLAERSDGRRILFPVHHDLVDRFELFSGLPGDQFVDANDTTTWEAAKRTPARSGAQWIVWIGVDGGEDVARAAGAVGAGLCYDAALPDPQSKRVRIYWVNRGPCSESDRLVSNH